MDPKSFYVYALKDPRTNPAKPFYIGKGTGIRAWGHHIKADNTNKGNRIRTIQNEGFDVIISKLIEDLTEIQALQLEAELISSFGTEANGGILTNTVIPRGIIKKAPKNIVVPMGSQEKAQLGLSFLKDAIIELIQANPQGITNAEASKSLGLQSDYMGGSKDYLSFSIIGLLIREGRVFRKKDSPRHCTNVK